MKSFALSLAFVMRFKATRNRPVSNKGGGGGPSSFILVHFFSLITKDLEKHFRKKSSDIKTWRFGDDMSPLSNVNYRYQSYYNLHLIMVTCRRRNVMF